MKILIVLFGLLAWIGCHDENSVLNDEIMEVEATWANELAADGCSWHFSVSNKDSTYYLLPDEASRKTIEAELGVIREYYGFTPVYLEYSKTGKNAAVQCGWGKTGTYDEIRVIAIRKK
ncbi:hypothetical protein [Dyadobacter crusticola]|uniref:hypothetical protein n=1 Tax=Dyadobacter crusticola TaxID=292407 RepID=UPI0004E0F20B|nr:hypothetical protein [Dyadobacter crusticola]